MVTTFDEYRRFSINDLKSLGFMQDGFSGWLNWTKSGNVESTIGVNILLSGSEPHVILHYQLTKTGTNVRDRIALHFAKSNLPNRTGFWLFVCPVTHTPCKILYLSDGHFKSRRALPGTLYESQNIPAYFRSLKRLFDNEEVTEKLWTEFKKPYSKMTYRGKGTRRLQRLEKKEDRFSQIMQTFLRERSG